MILLKLAAGGLLVLTAAAALAQAPGLYPSDPSGGMTGWSRTSHEALILGNDDRSRARRAVDMALAE